MEKNLNNDKALQKYTKLVEEINVCMLLPSTQGEQRARPMSTSKVEADGTTWFFSGRTSEKVEEIQQDHTVRLLYAHPGKSSYMDVRGKASVVNDRDKMKELWNPIIKAWFPKGIDDPNLCLLKVSPADAHYWDSESGKMIQFLKIMTSAVTGKELEEGVQGELQIGK